MPPPIELIESSDGVAVAVHDLGGPDDAPVLLLAHANGFNAGAWRPFAAALTSTHRVVGLDLRGHGVARTPEGLDFAWERFGDDVVGGHGVARTPEGLDFAWERFGDDVVAVLDSGVLPRGPLHGVGHSLGGASLVMAAAQRPGAFRSLWLFEPIIPPPDAFSGAAGENPLAEGAARRRPTFASLDAAYDNYASKPPLNAFHPDALRGYVEGGFEPLPDGTVTLRTRPQWEAAIFRMTGGCPAWTVLPSVDIPVTVVVGEEMAMGPAAFAPVVVEALPNGRLVRHPELSHFGPLQDPIGLAGEVAAWIAGG